jgi:hypothetical protein
MTFEDYLYDEHIYRSSDPQQVLEDLESLYKGMWNQRSNTLDWHATMPAPCLARPPIRESNPTRTIRPAPNYDRSPRNRPSDAWQPATPHN